MKKVTIGEMFIQDNQERKFGGDPQYVIVWAVPPDGQQAVPLLFTEENIVDAIIRANSNPEDILELGSEAPINKFDAE